MLGEYTAQWSPVENVLIMDKCLPILGSSPPAIYRADAPDFIPVLLNGADIKCQIHPISIWSPDGQQVFFTGSDPENGSPMISSVWAVGQDGSNPLAINPEENTGWSIEFQGWLDDHTLLYTIYAGGGNRTVRFLDTLSGEITVEVGIHGYFQEMNGNYLAGTFWAPNSIPIVISPSPEFGDLSSILGGEYTRLLPLNIFEGERFNDAHFEDWRHDTPQMLVRYIEHSYEGENYSRIVRLVLWDVEADSASIIAEGGVDGQFSPDGDVLAFLTFGPPWLNPDGTPIKRHYAPIPLDQPTYLNLLDMRSQIVEYSVPAVDEMIQAGIENDPADRLYKLLISFSPDGRYLAYFAPNDTSGATLNVLDLNTMQVVYTTPADTLRPVWSPGSDSMIFRDSQMRLNVLDRTTMTAAPIIESGGQRVQLIDWSFDGQYITLSLRESQQGHPYTAVLPRP
jgi:WD40 repeat protein